MGARGELWVVIQAALLILLVFVPHVGPVWPATELFRIGGGIVFVIGLATLGVSALHLGRSLTPLPRPVDDGVLVTRGAYRYVRHPIYLGVLLAALGYALATTSPLRLLLTAVLFVFFDMKARREERWLQERYPDYEAYRRRVRKLIPWIY